MVSFPRQVVRRSVVLNQENPRRFSTEEASAEGRDLSAHPLNTCTAQMCKAF